MSDAQATEAEKNVSLFVALLPGCLQRTTVLTRRDDARLQIEIWKVKKLIKRLEAARGNGTSMISLIIRMLPAPFPKI